MTKKWAGWRLCRTSSLRVNSDSFRVPHPLLKQLLDRRRARRVPVAIDGVVGVAAFLSCWRRSIVVSHSPHDIVKRYIPRHRRGGLERLLDLLPKRFRNNDGLIISHFSRIFDQGI